MDNPSYFFFGQNRRVTHQVTHFTGRTEGVAGTKDGKEAQGASVTSIRALEDWVHTVNQHLIREMKSRINKRWHLRKFKGQAVQQSNLQNIDLNSIKRSVYDHDGRSLVYYYHTFAEG
jgi:hypothetical protein